MGGGGECCILPKENLCKLPTALCCQITNTCCQITNNRKSIVGKMDGNRKSVLPIHVVVLPRTNI